MPSFHYKAVRFDGEAVEGEMEAPDEAAVIRHLQAEGLIPIEEVLGRTTNPEEMKQMLIQTGVKIG